MQLKTIMLSIATLAACGAAHAQDKIYKRDGDVVPSKIKSVGTKTISYVRFNNQSGPEYTMAKADVQKITYENGSEDVFDMAPTRPSLHPIHHHSKGTADADDKDDPKIKYGANVLAIAPVQFSENGLGLGISYERALDHNANMAFYLPLIATFNLSNGTYYDPNTNTSKNGNSDIMMYAMPGIKFYPTGAYGSVRYAVGPSLVIADGQKSNSVYDPITGASSYQTQDHFMLGLMVHNSVNFNPSKHVYMGLELGFGFTYLNRIGGLNQDTQGLAQGSFKIGYRF